MVLISALEAHACARSLQLYVFWLFEVLLLALLNPRLRNWVTQSSRIRTLDAQGGTTVQYRSGL